MRDLFGHCQGCKEPTHITEECCPQSPILYQGSIDTADGWQQMLKDSQGDAEQDRATGAWLKGQQ